MALVDGIEAWSSNWNAPNNHNTCNLRYWREQLAAGYAPVAVAAADFHGPERLAARRTGDLRLC